MTELIQFLIGIAVFALAWYFLRSIAKTFSKINDFEEKQNEISDTLEAIKKELKELNKNNLEK